MQSAALKTPATNKRGSSAAKISSGKKLVQARLPFKIISSGTTPSAGDAVPTKEADTPAKDTRKRRLSFNPEETPESTQIESDAIRGRSASKENLTSAKKNKIDDGDDVVLLDDDDILEDEDEPKAEEKKVDQDLKIKKDKGFNVASPNRTKIKSSNKKISNSPHTPKAKEDNNKGTNTPKSTNIKKSTTPGSAKNKASNSKASGSASKVQIKLPLGSSKANKRRKSKNPVKCVDTDVVISSDENESNSVKRPKVDGDPKNIEDSAEKAESVINSHTDKVLNTNIGELNTSSESVTNSNVLVLEIGENETDVPDSELDSRCSSITVISKENVSDRVVQSHDCASDANKTGGPNSLKLSPSKSRKDKVQTGDSNSCIAKSDKDVISSFKTKDGPAITKEKQSVEKRTSPTEDIQAKDVDNKLENISIVIATSSDSEYSSTTNEESKSHAEEKANEFSGTPKIAKEISNTALKKNLTPKQIKLMEQRRKAREEKERRLQEEKMQKQRDKEAKELAKKREREEREEQRRKEREEREEQKRKEREERDEQKRKEREEKERKRQAEQEVKNEEKRKRNEAKEEELRKKEEDRKRKEGADLKAKKEAEAFQKFFKTKRTSNEDGETGQQQAHHDDGCDPETLAFRPFEVKGDMKLAPLHRKQLSPEHREQLDAYLVASTDTLLKNQDLYLAELKCGKINPGRWRRISVDTKVSDDDVQIIDDLDRAGLAIVEETHAPIEHFRAKFYKFHENRRPPYYGTWRKRTNVIKPRRPFVQDTKFFDYEIDSDLEWEEEEPGESLDGSDDEKEKESEDDDYEVDNEWFVPHGHLSEEELQNEDEVLDANTREAQKAKLQVLQQEFAQEMKKKTEKIKPRLIGCIWTDENGNQPALCPKIIWDTLNIRAMLCENPLLLEDPEVPEKNELGSPTSNGNEKTVEKVKPIKLTDRMLKDLVCLVHGNQHSKNFLIKEFIAYLEANEESIKNGEVRGPIKSIVREKIDDFAEWTVTDSVKVLKNSKKKNKKRLCWVVSSDVLKKMDLENLSLRNTWKYTLQPRAGKVEIEVETDASAKETTEVADNDETQSEIEVKQKTKVVKNKFHSNAHKDKKAKSNIEITKFTKVLPAKTAAQKSPKTTITPRKELDSKTTSKESKPAAKIITPTSTEAAPKIKKRVPLLMSVARGQQISQPTKNALISEFLQKSSAEKGACSTSKNESTAPKIVSEDVIEVVELD